MKRDDVSRRSFLKENCVMAGGLLAGMWGLSGCVSEEVEAVPGEVAAQKSRVLNCHPQMAYRRLGKTDLMVSEIVLAGQFGDQSSPPVRSQGGKEGIAAEVVQNRTAVISACIDCGINYLDVTSGEEALAYRDALKRRWDQIYVAVEEQTRLTLACVLCNPDLSAVAVAMNSASQVRTYAEVSAQRRGQA